MFVLSLSLPSLRRKQAKAQPFEKACKKVRQLNSDLEVVSSTTPPPPCHQGVQVDEATCRQRSSKHPHWPAKQPQPPLAGVRAREPLQAPAGRAPRGGLPELCQAPLRQSTHTAADRRCSRHLRNTREAQRQNAQPVRSFHCTEGTQGANSTQLAGQVHKVPAGNMLRRGAADPAGQTLRAAGRGCLGAFLILGSL